MALLSYVLGQGSVILRVKVLRSDVQTGAGLQGLSPSSPGLIIAAIADDEAVTTPYSQAAGTIQSIAVLGTYQAPSPGSCRFGEIDPTHHPGDYEVQLANARYNVGGCKSLLTSLLGAASMAETDVTIALQQLDPYNANPTIGGLNAAALADFFTIDSGERYANAVAGSPVKEIVVGVGIQPPAPVITLTTTLGSVAVTLNITVDQYADLVFHAAVNDASGNPINLTGATGKMQVRVFPGSANPAILEASTTTGGGNGYMVLGNGTIDIAIPYTVMDVINPGQGYNYDMWISPVGGHPRLFYKGLFQIQAGVTVP